MADLALKDLKALSTKKASLADQVYEKVHWAIITGKISSGSRLIETDLAGQLGVSRTPVREALQRLVSEGTLQAIPRAGYLVEDMSERDVMELFKARMTVEAQVARLAAQRVTPEGLAALEKNLEATNRLLQDKPTRKMIDLDVEFHQLLSTIANSKIFSELNELLIRRNLRFRIFALRIPVVARVSRDGHAQVVEAMRRRDPDLAEKALVGHLEDTRKTVAGCVGKLRQDSFLAFDVDFYDQ